MKNKASSKSIAGVDKSTVLTREEIRSPSFVSIYANDIQVQTSPWDMHFDLGEISILPTRARPIMTINKIAELRISPQLAKVLTGILMKQVAAYEEQFGEIPAPPEPKG